MITHHEAIGLENIDAVREECNKMVEEVRTSSTPISLAERVVLNRIVALLREFLDLEIAKTSVVLAWALGKGIIDLDKYDNIKDAIID